MNADTHQQLFRSLEALISGAGPLSMRLFCAAAGLYTISPEAFDDRRLRAKFKALEDDLIMMGVIPVGPDAPVTDLDAEPAGELAFRVLDLVFDVANSEVE